MPRNNNTAKRKDSKGRVLRTGESQRKDGTYDFRYMDSNHKRRSIYAMTLEDLRRKEDELTTCKTMGAEDCTTVEDLRKKEAEAMICAIMGIDLSKGHITVIELVEQYVKHKRNVRAATQTGYERRSYLGKIQSDPGRSSSLLRHRYGQTARDHERKELQFCAVGRQ